MEWIGTGFVLTIGGVRLRLRIALEDTPEPLPNRRDGAAAAAKKVPAVHSAGTFSSGRRSEPG